MSYQYKDINKYGVVKIPKHWDLTILSRVAEVIDPEPSHRAPAFAKGEGFPYVGIRDINYDGTINVETARPIEEESLIEQEKRFTIEPSDIVFCRVATLGLPKILKTDKRIALSATLALIKSKKGIDYRYLLYYLESNVIKVQTALYATGSTRKSLGMETIRKFSVFVPPYEEQVEIAKYLKSKLGVIDNLISDKSNIINLLEEKRKSMITEAVTKGLNPNVKIKCSGVEWIGEIPEHWIKSKLKYVSRQIIDGAHHTPNYQNSGIPFLRVTDITKSKGKKINLEEVKFISEEEHLALKKRCCPEKGDLLVSKNGTIGIPKVIDWNFDFSIFVSLCLIKLRKEKLDSSFSSYFFESDLVEEQIASGSKKSTIVNLHLDKIKEFIVFLPPLEEQREIVKYLNAVLKEYDKLTQEIQVQLEQLKEYRQSLIYEAVTGKIDVRDFEVKA